MVAPILVVALLAAALQTPARGFRVPSSTLVPATPRYLSAVSIEPACPARQIRVEKSLGDIVGALCRDSLTFQRQSARIGTQSSLSVDVRRALRRQGSARAWTRMNRGSFPTMRAEVEIVIGGDDAELIGHELEHVMEWLDGIHDGRRPNGERGVIPGRPGEILETARAVEVGRTVSRELAAARQQRARLARAIR